MAKRGGFPGGGMPGNMSNLMKQAQRMQRQMEESQKELEVKEFTAKAGKTTVYGNMHGSECFFWDAPRFFMRKAPGPWAEKVNIRV